MSARWPVRCACMVALGVTASAGAQESSAPPVGEYFGPSAFERPAVAVRGPLTPGAPVAITLTVRAVLPTRPAVVSVALPDLWQYEWQLQHPGASIIGQRETPLGEWRIALDSGQMFTQVVTAVIPYAGYYRVAVQARAPEGMVRGMPVQAYARAEIWLLVDECGGRVLPSLSLRDFTGTPIDRARPNIGPFRVHGRLQPAPPSCP